MRTLCKPTSGVGLADKLTIVLSEPNDDLTEMLVT
jgi:hypothetical protein